MTLPTLRVARHRAGLTQRELAGMLGIGIPVLMGHCVLGTGGLQDSSVSALGSGTPGSPDAVWTHASPDDEAQEGSDR